MGTTDPISLTPQPRIRTQHRIAMWNSLLFLQTDTLPLCQTAEAASIVFDSMMEAEEQLALAYYDQQKEIGET